MVFVCQDKGAFMLHLFIVVCVCIVGLVHHGLYAFQYAAGGNFTFMKSLSTFGYIFEAST